MKKKISLVTLVFLAVVSYSQINVLQNGKTGIGLSMPIEQLHVNGAMVLTNTTGSITSSPFIQGNNSYSSSTSPDYTWYNNDQTGMFHPAIGKIGFSSNGNTRFTIETTSSYFQTYQNWDPAIYIRTQHSNGIGYNMRLLGEDTYYVHASGYIYSQGQYIGSDLNLKKSISSLDSKKSLELTLKLNPVKFKYKVIEGAERTFLNDNFQIGFVAQEIEELVPEVVLTTEDGTKAVAYQNLVALLVGAVQEQSEQIEKLEEKLDKVLNGKEIDLETGKVGELFQNTPNPFSEKTIVGFDINMKKEDLASISIMIFDLNGGVIMTKDIDDLTERKVEISSGDMKPGMYLYSLIVNGQEVDTKKMILTAQ